MGASPAKDTLAATPPTVAVTAEVVCASGETGEIPPSAGVLFTGPNPVPYSSMYSPRRAGRDPGKAPAGAASDAVPEISTSPWPLPCWLVQNSPGPYAANLTLLAAALTPPADTTSEACVLPAISHGTWKLSWVGEA